MTQQSSETQETVDSDVMGASSFDDFGPIDFNQELSNIQESEMDDLPQLNLKDPHVLVPKTGISSFLALASIQSKLGSDSYSKSIKIRRKDSSTLELKYYNGMSYAEQDLKINANDNPIQREYVVALNSLNKVLSFGSAQVPIIEKEDNLYAYLYGGQVYIEHQEVSLSYYDEFRMEGEIESEHELDAEVFLATVRDLTPLITASARSEERAIYFAKDAAYVYSGVVVGAFAGNFTDVTLQLVDTDSVLQMFKGYSGTIKLIKYPNYLVFSTKDRKLCMPRKTLKLDDALKVQIREPKEGVNVNAVALYDILNVLSNLPQNSGVVSLIKTENGLTVESPQRSGEESSTFPLQATQIGDGIKGNLKVPVRSIKDYLRAFKNSVILNIVDNKLTIYGDNRILEISGTSLK